MSTLMYRFTPVLGAEDHSQLPIFSVPPSNDKPKPVTRSKRENYRSQENPGQTWGTSQHETAW